MKKMLVIFIFVIFTFGTFTVGYGKVNWGSAYKYRKAKQTGKCCCFAVALSCLVPGVGPGLAQLYLEEKAKAITLLIMGGVTCGTVFVTFMLAFWPVLSPAVDIFVQGGVSQQNAIAAGTALLTPFTEMNFSEVVGQVAGLAGACCLTCVSFIMYEIIMIYSTIDIIDSYEGKSKQYNLEIVSVPLMFEKKLLIV